MCVDYRYTWFTRCVPIVSKCVLEYCLKTKTLFCITVSTIICTYSDYHQVEIYNYTKIIHIYLCCIMLCLNESLIYTQFLFVLT